MEKRRKNRIILKHRYRDSRFRRKKTGSSQYFSMLMLKTNKISDICHKSQEPIFVTKNGYGDLVVMSIEAYERLITDTQIDAAIAEAETEMEGGAVLMDAREALSGLRRKYAK